MADENIPASVGTVALAGAPKGPGSANPKQGQRMTGAQAVVASLEAEGVELLFGYPGGQVIHIYDALYDSKTIRHVLARHEQGAVHEADGYARATGDVGVALVTSGPGATNTVTGIATAYLDSVPLVVVTGQVPLSMIGTDAFQESDIFGITIPVVKHSYLVKSADDIASTLRKAFHIAKTGRPGPVLVDIPSDVARQETVFEYADFANIASYKPTYRGNARQVRQAAALVREAKRPVLLAGGGAVVSGAGLEVSELAHLLNIPIVTTLMALGAVPSGDPLNLGLVGMHGSRFANKALNGADLIIACGSRFSDRVTGKISSFAPEAKLIHIDIDPVEIDKVRKADVPIVGELKGVLEALLAQLKTGEVVPQTDEWLSTIAGWRERYPMYDGMAEPVGDEIIPERALCVLSEMLDPAASIVVTEVGQHQMWAAQHIARDEPRTFLSSGGLGTMGFGLPAAIGAALGRPEKQVVCIAGDGSLQMNMQEMATATINGIPIKVIVVNNSALGMVRQWQKLFLNQRYSATELHDVPDFVMLARSFSWQAERIEHPSQVRAAFARMLAADGPYLIDMRIERDQSVFPIVAPGKALSEAVGALDFEEGR